MAQRAKRGARIRALMITGVIALGALQALSAHAAVDPVTVSYPASGAVIPSGTSLTVWGSGPVNSTIRLSDNNGVVLTTTSNGGGSFNLDLGQLTDGSHFLQVRAADALGAEGPVTDVPFTVSSDTLTPSITGPTGWILPTVFAVRGTGQPGAKIDVFEGNVSLGRATATSNGSWTKDVALTSGSHSLVARATDTAGHVSGFSQGFSYFVDGQRPTATIDKPANNALIAFCGTGPGATPLPSCPLPVASPLHFEGKAGDAGPTDHFGVKSISVKFVNALTGETALSASPCTGCGINTSAATWSLDPNLPQGGYYDVIVTSTDFAGNVSNTAAIEVFIL